MTGSLRILLIDDNPDDRALVARELQREFAGVAIEQVSAEPELERAVSAGAFDLAITDYQLLWSDGLRVLHAIRARLPDVPVIMFTATGTEEIAVEAMKNGLDDYVIKRPWHFARLPASVRKALDLRRHRDARGEAERRYQGLFEGAPIGLHRTTEDGTIEDANPALLRIMGCPDRDTLLRTNARDLYADPEERDRWVREIAARGALDGFEVRMRRFDGRLIWIRHHVRRHQDAAGRVYFEGAVEDITERKEAEEALAKSEERLRLSQRLESVGRLAGGVAHDFNNLLTVITGHADLLLRRLPADQDGRRDLEEIRRAGERAAGLTRQLLAFSRRQVLQLRVLSLNAVVGDMQKMLPRLIGEDVRLETALAQDLGSTRADPGQIEQVIVNLAVNARDAMPKGGALTISTRNADLDASFAAAHPPTEPGRYVLLAVADTGVGMDRSLQAHVFEPFFTTKEAGKGTGLGLATVYGIVKQSGGYIWVDSEPGRGSVFSIYLPRVDAPPDRIQPQRTDGALTGSETVLVVEDEATLREVVRAILAARGYTVMTAAEAEEAERLAREHAGPLHLLLTDVVMPGRGGKELAGRLTPGRPGLRVLFMTGYTDETLVRHGVLEAGVDLIQKPFTPGALARKVREVLDRPDQGPASGAG